MSKIVTYLGEVLKVYSVFQLMPLVVAAYYNEDPSLFIISSVFSLILGLSIHFYTSRRQKEIETGIMSLGESFLLSVVSFLIICLLGSIPYLTLFNFNPFEALFVSVSGFTTTGISLPYHTPLSVLFWHAESLWIGGLGIILLFLFIITKISRKNETIAQEEEELETHFRLFEVQGYTERFDSSLSKMISKLFSIYLFFTIVGILLLLLTGIGTYDSIVLAFSAISTGGFTSHNIIAQFSARVIFVLCLIMLTGAIPFLVHFKLLKGMIKDFMRYISFYISTLVVFISIGMLIKPKPETAFYVVSALTTTGQKLPHLSFFPPVLLMLIIFGMITGGNAGSTAGGIKANRLLVALKSIGWYLRHIIAPKNAIIPLKVNKKKIEKDTLLYVLIFIFTYFLILGVTTFVFVCLGFKPVEALFLVSSALGNVGFSITGLSLGMFAKTLLICLMILGRLEIFPLLLLFYRLTRKTRFVT